MHVSECDYEFCQTPSILNPELCSIQDCVIGQHRLWFLAWSLK
jgi:hypothetical protein